MASDGIDPATLSVSDYDHIYPTPPPMPQEVTATPASQSKKKRKAWGQPVPEIKQILPPRKRAKTAEEKEQRKNERILRNRRAADKSRQRQKAAVADLEVKQGRIEQENAMLRQMLAGYQQRFGVQSDLQLDFTSSTHPTDLQTATSPLSLDSDAETPTTAFSYTTPAPEEQQPTFVHTDSTVSIKHESPVLAPTLSIENQPKSEESAQPNFDNLNTTSVMTQYPAAILCDLQCQAEVGDIKTSTLPFRLGLSQLLQMIQYLTIYQAFSTSMLLPMYQIFQLLGQKLAMSSMEQTFPSILRNFPLIHSLISMPSTPTRPAVFRLKLLSRLLACSPLMARLLLAATDRALQQVVSEDDFAKDPDRRWTWASLMTIKWGILRLEREHRKIRHSTKNDHDICQGTIMAGVDMTAVTRSSRLWMEPRLECINRDERWATTQEVH